MHFIRQKTIASPISFKGVGLHSGLPVSMVIHPAKAGNGIVFRRLDLLEEMNEQNQTNSQNLTHVKAEASNVTSTCLGTTITNSENSAINVATIEHLMAALSLTNIDNAIVDMQGPEVPILDGSASIFVDAINTIGFVDQEQKRETLVVTKPWKYENKDSFIQVEPSDRFEVSVEINFKDPAIGRQQVHLAIDELHCLNRLKGARTFCEFHTVEAMQAAGLGQGGSFDNAIVVDNGRLLNGASLRDPDEFALHKALDLMGDLALLGKPILGRISAYKPGHALNNEFCRAFLKQESSVFNCRPLMAATERDELIAVG